MPPAPPRCVSTRTTPWSATSAAGPRPVPRPGPAGTPFAAGPGVPRGDEGIELCFVRHAITTLRAAPGCAPALSPRRAGAAERLPRAQTAPSPGLGTTPERGLSRARRPPRAARAAPLGRTPDAAPASPHDGREHQLPGDLLGVEPEHVQQPQHPLERRLGRGSRLARRGHHAQEHLGSLVQGDRQLLVARRPRARRGRPRLPRRRHRRSSAIGTSAAQQCTTVAWSPAAPRTHSSASWARGGVTERCRLNPDAVGT